MPAIYRLGDLNSGPSGNDIAITGSGNVFVNNKKVIRQGDTDIGPQGTDTFVSGSSKVFVNNKQVIRIGDMDTKGDTATTGSPNVYAG
jgi:uncharacterized Zn-binding protein involved in type VI secretion